MRFADAHIHLFGEGYHRPGLPSLFGDRELQAYEALRLCSWRRFGARDRL
jgi:hypothetical protein